MAMATVETGQLTDRELMAHLFRRAGFGATQEELEGALASGYEATVEQLAASRAAARRSTKT